MAKYVNDNVKLDIKYLDSTLWALCFLFYKYDHGILTVAIPKYFFVWTNGSIWIFPLFWPVGPQYLYLILFYIFCKVRLLNMCSTHEELLRVLNWQFFQKKDWSGCDLRPPVLELKKKKSGQKDMFVQMKKILGSEREKWYSNLFVQMKII